jgi:hypothetical protein
MKKGIVSICIAVMMGLSCPIPIAQAKDGELGASSVGVSTITFVLHPNIFFKPAKSSDPVGSPPLSVTSNLDKGSSLERIAVSASVRIDKGARNHPAQRTRRIAYVVVPKAN